MRGLLASSIGVTCAAALALPLTPPADAATVRPAPAAEAASAGTAGATSPGARTTPTRPDLPDLPGSTQSLPLSPLTGDRALGGVAGQGLSRRDVRRFSLLGVVWDDPAAELHGRVQVRTRPAGSDAWSGWQDVETHNADHGADPGTTESASGRTRGATAPLWVGDSDGVEVRVRPQTERRTEETGRGARTLSTVASLPAGLRLDLVDPGRATVPRAPAGPPHSRALSPMADPPGEPGALDPAGADTPVDDAAPAGTTELSADLSDDVSAEAFAASAANEELAPLGALEIPGLDRPATERELLALRGGELTQAQRATPYIGPRPSIVTRRGWGADESLRESGFRYTTKVKAAFVHHTASGNTYTCAQAPSVIRGIYRYHVKSMGWRDIGYNFLVDKCGKIYEGRAGGVAKPVLGAHTLGFNTNSMGIAVLGTFGSAKPTAATVDAVARLTAWKLGLFGANPNGKTYLTSGGGNLYGKGQSVRLNVISGHRDGFATECPGKQLYGKLGSARSTAARYQGR
ncbi:peptidoglycan recognition protein family protein [Streptomyces hilarionis]|uniref:peptidoglycan recognition protein family protein n=1 Tax=Streptomyces hilarionis TaxID=2839954 RepID=UPI002119F391|nr:peptidoglycan recognition protein [Streptomyces hilarionis]MCQ9130024.1 peptidoglycan recognition protein [Streptomyces hilarionis]